MALLRILSAAADMPTLGLSEALELCLLPLDQKPEKFIRVAVRWHGRYCREVNAGGSRTRPLRSNLPSRP